MTEHLDCENSVLGLTSASSDGKTPAKTLCMRASNCSVKKAFNYRAGETVTAWSVKDSFLLTYACEARDGACPEAAACSRQTEDENAPFRWLKATESAKALRQPGDGRTCRYANPIEPRALVRALDANWDKVDIVCSSTVTCRPGIEDQVVVSPPRKIDFTKGEIECPPAMDAVAERFPLDKPKKKEDLAARPHGGRPAPAQNTSGSGSTHAVERR
jgi:hypothetical protein